MRSGPDRLLALTFGLVCGAVLGGIEWCWLRPPMREHAETRPRGPPARLTGRVREGEHGVAGARVYVIAQRDGFVHQPGIFGGNTVELRKPGFRQIDFMESSDADGRFEMELDASGDLTLYALLTGGGEPPPVHLELTPGGTSVADVVVAGPRITGRVVDAVTGRGLAKAEIWLKAFGWPGPVVTDGDGRFTVACVPPGNETLCVRCMGHVARQFGPIAVDPASDSAEVLIALDPEAVVEGSLLDGAGHPLLDPRWVILFHDDLSPQPSGEDMRSTTARDGRFRIDGVAAGRQRVGMMVRVDGDLAWRLEYFLPSIEFVQTFDIGVGQTVEVTLQDSVSISPAAPTKH